MTIDVPDAQKKQVITFIVDATFYKSLVNALQPRTMEEAGLDSFKDLNFTAKDHPKEYKEVYKTYCEGPASAIIRHWK